MCKIRLYFLVALSLYCVYYRSYKILLKMAKEKEQTNQCRKSIFPVCYQYVFYMLTI